MWFGVRRVVTVCRGGKILRALERGEGRPEDIEQLSKLTRELWIGKTFCAHAPGAMEPIMRRVKIFPFQNLNKGIRQSRHDVNG